MIDDLHLGRLIGRREAFSAMAARCSSAEAQQLKDIRDSKAYLSQAKDWETFCATILHISDDTANRIIHLLEKFGSPYFEIAQLTRVSAKTYPAIAGAIHDGALHHNGEIIPLDLENAPRVAAAVAEIRKQNAAPPALPAPEAPAENAAKRLERRCAELVDDFVSTGRECPQLVRAILYSIRQRMDALERTL